jgi:glucokinase
VSILAADIGGTHTRVACIDGDGLLAARNEVATNSARGAQTALRELGDLFAALVADVAGPLHGIGLSITGPVDTTTGIVDNPHTLPGWGPTDVIRPLQQRFGVPVKLVNDADAAALGEWRYGAGRGARRLAMITIGTGIGLGVIIDGTVQCRADGAHAEAGHHLMDPQGPECTCGARGCWEALASGPALLRLARAHGFSGADPLDPSAGAVAAVISAAESGQARATAIFEQIAQWVALGLVNTAAFLVPDVIVIGGGLGTRCYPLLEPTITMVLQRHQGIVRADMAVRGAITGDNAGLLGAATSVAADGRTHTTRLDDSVY